MKNKWLLIVGFLVVCVAQLYVPAQMIIETKNVLVSGKLYKFKTAPIDPYDPFRGKYIILRFQQSVFNTSNAVNWKNGDPVYVLIKNDQDGFATVTSISKQPPKDKEYIKAEIDYSSGDMVMIKYPFDRLYMNEAKAQGAETVYMERIRDTSTKVYATVSVKDGIAVLKDVMINDTSIAEFIK